MNSLRKIYATDSGMHCIWNSEAFAGVIDYDTWENELLEDSDIEKHIRNGHFVPVGVDSDGAFEIEVRLFLSSEAVELSEREKKYLTVSSQPYLFRSSGRLNISGIEFVESQPGNNVGQITSEAIDYTVYVHLIAWDEEPGMQDDKGNPKPEALPDYIVCVTPIQGNEIFRTKAHTFDPP